MPTQKHNIDILIASDNINILNALPLPNESDPRLWNVEYRLGMVDYMERLHPIEFEGANILIGHICFEDLTERDNIIVSLRASQGLFRQCRKESYLREVLSDHEFPVNERTGSQIVKQYGRDSSENGQDSMGIYVEDFAYNVSQGRVY